MTCIATAILQKKKSRSPSGMTSKKSKGMTGRKSKCESDAVVVGAPVDDALFDGFGLEALGDGLVDESGEFCV